MVPGLLERERLGAEMRRQQMLTAAARERLVDTALASRPRAAVPGWRWSVGGLLVQFGSRLQGAGRAVGSAPMLEPHTATTGR